MKHRELEENAFLDVGLFFLNMHAVWICMALVVVL